MATTRKESLKMGMVLTLAFSLALAAACYAAFGSILWAVAAFLLLGVFPALTLYSRMDMDD